MALKKTRAEPLKEEVRAAIAAEAPETEPVNEPVKAVAQDPDYLVYLGPSLRGYISKNQIIPRPQLLALDRVKEKYPDVKYLLVPGDQVASSRAMIKRADNFLASVYERLAGKA